MVTAILTAVGQVIFAILFGLLGLIMLVLMVGVYMLPAVWALSNGRRDVAALAIVNLFLGWSLIAWVLCLAWAFLPNPPAPAPICDDCGVPLNKPDAWLCRDCEQDRETEQIE